MDHREYLLEALKLAKQRQGFCAPNPAVGAVLVKNNQIIATGYHYGAGYDHAEAMACQDLTDNLSDTVLYITLEPCCHWGKKPPCTDLIIQKKISKVIYGFVDPYPKVSGKGAQVLTQNNIECQHISLTEINDFYSSYSYWLKTQLPWVTAKLAISLDAKIADEAMQPVKITQEAAKEYTHLQRLKSDAIFTSVTTIIQDNPSLNVKLSTITAAKPLYIVDRHLSLPLNAQIFTTAQKITAFYSQATETKITALQKLGVTCYQVADQHNYLDLQAIIKKIGSEGMHRLWVEAGGKIFNALINQNLVNKSLIYIAPTLLGSKAYSAFSTKESLFAKAKNIQWYNLGQDGVCEIDW